jgi:hypothetical protein
MESLTFISEAKDKQQRTEQNFQVSSSSGSKIKSKSKYWKSASLQKVANIKTGTQKI